MVKKYLSWMALGALLLAAHGTVIAQNGMPSWQLKPVDGFLQTPPDGNIIQPTGVAVDRQGHVYAFNKGNRQLMEFDSEGKYLRSLGAGIFKDPHGLRIDEEGNIWATDLEAHLVLKLNPQGRVLMVLGQNGTAGLYDDTRGMILFNKPADVAFGRNGDIYVADGYGNNRVVHLDKHGKLIRTWGEKGPQSGNFDNPHNIVTDREGKIYVADRYNNRVQVFSATGEFVVEWENLGIPWGLAIDPQDRIYMTDGNNEHIYLLNTQGEILGRFEGGPGSQAGQFRAAHGIAIDPGHALYVTEVLNWRVQRLNLPD